MKLGNYAIQPLISGRILVLSDYRPLNSEYESEKAFYAAKAVSDRNRMLLSLTFCVERLLSCVAAGVVTGSDFRAIKEMERSAQDITRCSPLVEQIKLDFCIYALRRFTKAARGISSSVSKDICSRLELIEDYYNLYCRKYEGFNNEYLAQ